MKPIKREDLTLNLTRRGSNLELNQVKEPTGTNKKRGSNFKSNQKRN